MSTAVVGKAKVSPLSASKAPFPVSENSPFADGYDIDAERQALADMVEQDTIDAADPRYPRYVELERRESELARLRGIHNARSAANREVEDTDALSFRDMGKLADEEEDTIDIHTLHAARLFLGREIKPGEKGYGMTGGKKVASCLRAMWNASSKDNPYADYALILATERMEEVQRFIDREGKKIQLQLDELQNQGLRFSILKNPKPYQVKLGFRSPYGYSVIMLINRFDYYVRQIKTLVSKSLITDRVGRDRIYEVTSKCRSIFEETVRFQRTLSREQLLPLSRHDFLPTADADAKKRVQAAVALLGELPREVFTGKIVPRHSKRTIDLPAAELKMLNEVPLAGEALPEEITQMMIN